MAPIGSGSVLGIQIRILNVKTMLKKGKNPIIQFSDKKNHFALLPISPER